MLTTSAERAVESWPISPPRIELRCQTYSRGTVIRLPQDSTLEILRGVVFQSAIHTDGSEVLVGFSCAGQVLTANEDSGCYHQLQALTDTQVRITSWAEAVHQPGFAERLRRRVHYLETWAAVQARPNVRDRLLGLLELLAQQFGRPHPQGTMIDLRLTHQHLSCAVGATRSTVTLVLGQLRESGAVLVLDSGGRNRFALPRRAACA